MRRTRIYNLYFVIALFIFTIIYFIYSNNTAESRGIKYYTAALETYKDADFEGAYQEFGKIPSASSLKSAALFRQARCATNMGKKELAIKKYSRILHNSLKSSIMPISEYNMANLMYEINDIKNAKKHYKHIIKKYPESDYAIASEYYLGTIEVENLPENSKKLEKSKQKALVYFKNYIEKVPDGRFALKSINEIEKLGVKLNNYDNLMIARAYYKNGEFDKAKAWLDKTSVSESWADFVKTYYKLGDKDKTKYYAELGFKNYAGITKEQDVFEAIDNYIAVFPTRKEGISAVLAQKMQSTGADYVAFLNCSEIVASEYKDACYRTLYEKYPNGQFSADSLYNMFLSKYLQKKYYDAQRLGFLHINKFPNVKSSSAVMYYMGKIAFKLKHYESANNYFKKVINEYPDSYYAFRANYNLYKDDGFLPFLEINPKPVVFPYKKSLDNNLVVKLAYLKDYDLVEELCKKDKFIQSWIAYEKGNYTISAVLARYAMEDLAQKPPFQDLRWRLVYPGHYYDLVSKYKGENNPIILESIIKEESHFNSLAKSSVGAQGLMQLMPSTYNEVVKLHNLPGNLNSESANVAAGSLYYASLKRALLNRDLYAIAAYNGGIGSVTNWFSKLIYNDTDEFVEQIPYPETKLYVKKVLRTYWMYGNIY